MVGVLPLERAFGHDREQGPQGRAGVLDRAVLEVLAGDALLGLGDVVDAVDEGLQVLRLGPENRLVEDAGRVVEDAAEERADELGRDAIAQPAGQHLAARVLEVVAAAPGGPRRSGTPGRARRAFSRHQISGISRLMS